MKTGWASRYVGIPYEPMGATPSGANCYGLLVLVYRGELGIELPWFGGINPEEAHDRDEFERLWLEGRGSDWWTVSRGDEREGDVVDLTVLGLPHCGIVAGGGTMLHSRPAGGSSIESYLRGMFCRRVNNLYRHKSMTS